MNEIVDVLRAAWKNGTLPDQRLFLSKNAVPLAESDQDQPDLDGVSNPLWEVVRWMPATHYFSDDAVLRPDSTSIPMVDLGLSRTALCKRYAWSIVSPGDVRWMTEVLDGRPVVEVGAGTGYWAWQLEQAGVDVAAYDPHPAGEDNGFCTGGLYTTVLRDDAAAVKHHQDRALLMVWPPYGGAHARHALATYEGDLLIYAGEPHGGCTADDGFYELLEAEWEPVSTSPAHVTWWGIHCRLASYQRKTRRP
ncbi:hypothetical protein [Streptomyces sp. NPDC001089]